MSVDRLTTPQKFSHINPDRNQFTSLWNIDGASWQKGLQARLFLFPRECHCQCRGAMQACQWWSRGIATFATVGRRRSIGSHFSQGPEGSFQTEKCVYFSFLVFTLSSPNGYFSRITYKNNALHFLNDSMSKWFLIYFYVKRVWFLHRASKLKNNLYGRLLWSRLLKGSHV